MRRMVLAIVVFCALTLTGAAQQQPLPRFEVASVKRNVSGESRTSYSIPPKGVVNITNTTLRMLVARAYGITPMLERFQLVVAAKTPLVRADNDLDDAMSAPRFDVQGKIPDIAQPGDPYEMLRTLLAERFSLRTHRESRRIPVYVLTVAREGQLGPQLGASSANGAPPLSFVPAASAPGMITLRSAGPITALVRRLQLGLDRPLIDDTHLSGDFAWSLSFEGPMNSFDALKSAPMFTALREQLGLELEARIAPYEVLVIDSVEMPTPN